MDPCVHNTARCKYKVQRVEFCFSYQPKFRERRNKVLRGTTHVCTCRTASTFPMATFGTTPFGKASDTAFSCFDRPHVMSSAHKQGVSVAF